MFKKHPRTQPGPWYPEGDCTGSAAELFGRSQEQVEKEAAELDAGSEEELYSDEDLSED